MEFTAVQAAQRAHLLRAFGAQLRRLSDDYNAAVVCVNQVCKFTRLFKQALVAQSVSAFGC